MILGKQGKYISNFLLFFVAVNLYLIWTSNKDFDSHLDLQRRGVNLESTDHVKSAHTASANDQYLLYSRVPKCGSETTLALMTNVSIANNVTMEVHQNRKYFEHQWFRPDASSVEEIKRTIFDQPPPFLYARHLYYFDLKVEWISLVREPISRKVSEYNYLRWRPSRPQGLSFDDKLMPIEKCFEYQLPECYNFENLTTLTQFFCGYGLKCRLDSMTALQLAKRNVAEHYRVVGILERYREFLQVIEHYYPKFFKGIVELYDEAQKKQRHKMNVTKHVHTASNTTRMMMTQKMIADVMLYQWLKQRFNILWNSLNLQQN